MPSLRQLRADQFDAQKSTGPTTEAGKAAGRRDALKHGLAGSGLVLPDEEAAEVNTRWAQWQSSLKPDDAYSDWMVERIASLAIRLERCEAHERALIEIRAARASRDWDLERRIAAELLGESLPKAPARAALELRRTPAGVAWLRTRWEALGAALEAGGTWDEAQRRLALDLLGTPRADRDGKTRVDAEPPALRALVEAEVAALGAIDPAGLAEADDFDRIAAELGFGPADRELALIRRYGRSLTKQIDEFRKQIKNAGNVYIPAGYAPDRPVPIAPARTARVDWPGPADTPPEPAAAGPAPASFGSTAPAARAGFAASPAPRGASTAEAIGAPAVGGLPEPSFGNRKSRRAAVSRSRRGG